MRSEQRTPNRVPSGDVAIVLTLSLVAAALIVLFRQLLLPQKFSYDGLKIQAVAQGALTVGDDKSYANVANLYRLLGLQDHPTAAGFLGLLAVAASLTLTAWSGRLYVDWVTLGAISISILLTAVYLGTYSKEVLVLAITVSVTCLRGRKTQVASYLLMAGYAASFRAYWFAILGAFIVLLYVVRKTPTHRKRIAVIVTMLLVVTVAAFAYSISQGVTIGTIRTALNSDRVGSQDATTLIETYLPDSGYFFEIANLVVTLVFLFVPLPLIILGTPYYLAIFAMLTSLWYFFGRGASAVLQQQDADNRDLAAVVYVLSFVAVQALFEPDYGSVLRHLVPVLPAVILIISRRPTVEETLDTLNSAYRTRAT